MFRRESGHGTEGAKPAPKSPSDRRSLLLSTFDTTGVLVLHSSTVQLTFVKHSGAFTGPRDQHSRLTSKSTMTVLNPRSHAISVRLSEEEFVALRQLCSVTGARSVSDLIRNAMHVLLNGANRDDLLGLRVDEIRTHLKSLDRKVGQLAARASPFSIPDDQ